MKKIFAAVAAAAMASAGSASAALYTFGAVTVDTDASVDYARVHTTNALGVEESDIENSFDTRFQTGDDLFPLLCVKTGYPCGTDPGGVAGNGPNTVPFASGVELDSNDIIEVGWGAGVLNGPGIDIIFLERFSDPDAMKVSLSALFTTFVVATLIDPDPLAPGVNVSQGVQPQPVILGNERTFYVFGIDLSDLGIAEGAVLLQNLFIRSTVSADYPGGTPSNLRFHGDPDIAGIFYLHEIPLPGAAPLFFAGLAGLAFARGRRKKA